MDAIDDRDFPEEVLIIEDDPIWQELIEKLITSRLPYGVRRAGSMVEGIEVLEHAPESPVLVLLDFTLPDGDGLKFLEVVRATASLEHVPVIIITGSEDHELALRAARFGIVDYIRKPFEPDHLVKSVARAVFRSQLSGE